MRYQDLLTEASVPFISPQEAKDRHMFGPVWHGTTKDINSIIAKGFSSKYSVPRNGIGRFNRNELGGPSNGYPLEPYFAGIAAPVHHLGFAAAYFTSVKAIAKKFNGNTTKNLKTFYLDIPNTLTINFGSPRTMMRFWVENGYDFTAEATQRGDWRAWIKATGNLTRNLRKYDAVHFLGKSIFKLLDGDQIAVYDSSRIYCINAKLASGLEIGAKVFHTQVIKKYSSNQHNQLYVDDLRPTDFMDAGKLAGKGWRGIFRAVDHDGNDLPRIGRERNEQFIGNYPIHMIPPSNVPGIITDIKENTVTGNKMYTVKWANGGTMYNYSSDELRPAVEK